ncbi:MAG: hypothetical protein ACKOTB_15430 [Planctomycetia bacterium]
MAVMPPKKRKPTVSRPPPAAPRRVEVITGPIARDRTLGKATTWVIAGEVHVRRGVTLKIAAGATLLIANGVVPRSRLRRATLIFDPGSALVAGRFAVRACNDEHRPIRAADNGGLWFLGTFAAGGKDGITVKKSRGGPPSVFRARSITASHLGRRDTYRSPKTGKDLDIGDGVDGLSLIGVGPDEWRVSEVRSLYSADDGFDVTNSHVRLDRLEVRRPAEDGLNVSSSRIEIRRSLVLDVPKSRDTDRDLFDLETDNGGSFVELPRGCWVRLRGVFGDQLALSSPDMPRPNTAAENEQRYAYSGRLASDAVIHSLTAD